jgi:hypothetical protein
MRARHSSLSELGSPEEKRRVDVGSKGRRCVVLFSRRKDGLQEVEGLVVCCTVTNPEGLLEEKAATHDTTVAATVTTVTHDDMGSRCDFRFRSFGNI